MEYIEDKDGNKFMVYTPDEDIPSGTELLQFANTEEAGAFALRLMATPEGREQLQRLLAKAYVVGEPPKPN